MFGNKVRKSTSIQSLIGSDTLIEGNLRFEGGCHIDGVVNGSVSGGNDPEAYLSVSEQGCIQGNVSVPRLALSGKVEGDVVVTERAELGPTARVDGNVHYNLIEIAAGAEINGKLIHETVAAKPVAKKPQTTPAKAAKKPLADAALNAAAKQNG